MTASDGIRNGDSDSRQSPSGQLLDHEVIGTGPRVVLVHGFTQTARSWNEIAEVLAGDHEVVTVDLPGHGRSAGHHADDLHATAAALATTSGVASYVGFSLGGRVCLTLALDNPDVVDRLVLIGATPGIVDANDREARVAADRRLADRLDPPEGSDISPLSLTSFLDEWLSGPLFSHLTAEHQGREARLENTPRGLAYSLRTVGAGTQVPSHGALGDLDMPVMLITGERDAKFTAIAAEMQAIIGPKAQSAVLPGVGHAVPFEDTDAFLECLVRFLADS